MDDSKPVRRQKRNSKDVTELTKKDADTMKDKVKKQLD